MNRIDDKFNTLRSEGRKAFIAYITAGDPDLATTRALALRLEASGADILELGIPFSDPIADGPTIQEASHRALAGKTTLKKIFAMAGDLRSVTDIPIVFMTYYNPVLRYGLKEFFVSCRKCGVDGVIVPDLPFEEAADLVALAKHYAVATVFLVAPTSTPQRIKNIAKISEGFIYYVSLTGVTGARRELPKDISSKIKEIMSITDKPIAVGFGVSGAQQAVQVARAADGVIVGSAIVKIISGKKSVVPRIFRFAKGLAEAIHGA